MGLVILPIVFTREFPEQRAYLVSQQQHSVTLASSGLSIAQSVYPNFLITGVIGESFGCGKEAHNKVLS